MACGNCPQCGVRVRFLRYMKFVLSSIGFLFLIVLVGLVYLAIGFGVGVGLGAACSAVFSLEFDYYGLPLFSWILGPLVLILVILAGAYYLIRQLLQLIHLYGHFTKRYLIAKMFYDMKKAFCSQNCQRDWMNDFKEKQRALEQVRRDEEREREDEIEEARIQRVRQHHNHTHGPPDSILSVTQIQDFQEVGSGFAHQPLPLTSTSTPNLTLTPTPSDFDVPPPPTPTMQNLDQEESKKMSEGITEVNLPGQSSSSSSRPTNTCCICLTNSSNILYYPCRHCSQCSSCPTPVMTVGKCPICRTVVERFELIFVT